MQPKWSSPRYKPRATCLENDLRAHTEKMDRMQRAAQKGAQDLLLGELERKLLEQSGEVKKEESHKQLLEHQKRNADKMKEVKKAAEKKFEKMMESQEKVRKKHEEQKQGLLDKASEAQGRYARNQARMEAERQEIKPKWSRERQEELRAQWDQKIEKIDEDNLRRQLDMESNLIAKHERKTQVCAEGLEEKKKAARESNERSAEKFEQHWERDQAMMKAEESRREEVFQRLQQAQEKREALALEAKKTYAVRNSKAQATHDKHMAEVLTAQEALEKELQQTWERRTERLMEREATQTSPRSPCSGSRYCGYMDFGTPMSRSISDGAFSAASNRRAEYREVVEWNKERLNRQRLHAEEEQKAKWDLMLRREKIMKDRRRQAAKLRLDLQKECVTERDNLMFEFSRTKSCPPGKMAPLIDRLNPNPATSKQFDHMLRKLCVPRRGAASDEEEEK